jgi:hypothetical protein
MELWGNDTEKGKNEAIGEKTAKLPLCPPQILQKLA